MKISKKLSGRKLLESEKFNVAIIVVNIVVIVGLVIGLIVVYINNNKSQSIDTSGSNINSEIVNDVDVDQLVEDADKTMPSVYAALIAGSDFDCGNGMEFHFGTKNEFSGFFDAKNTNVEGYFYEVVSENGKNIKLRILNTDKTKYVEYDMEFNSEGNILLTYPGMEQSILLAY